MADLKISELVSATSISTSDMLVVVQTGETRKVTPGVLFKNIPCSVINKEEPQVMSSGAISLSTAYTVIDSSNNYVENITLDIGEHGQEKEIFVKNISYGFTITLTLTNGVGFSTIVFSSISDYLKLKNISGEWYIVGIRGAISA